MDLYRETILDHYKNPHNFGELPDADIKVREANASCGDMIEISVKLQEASGKIGKATLISDIKFKGLGCAISMAATSLLTDFVKGKSLKEIENLTQEDVFKLLGGSISVGRVKCALLPLKAMEQVVKKYQGKDA